MQQQRAVPYIPVVLHPVVVPPALVVAHRQPLHAQLAADRPGGGRRHPWVGRIDELVRDRLAVHRRRRRRRWVHAGEGEERGSNVDIAADEVEGAARRDAWAADHHRDPDVVVVDVEFARRQTVLAEIVPVAERVKRRDSETLGLVRAKSRMESQFCQREEMEASI